VFSRSIDGHADPRRWYFLRLLVDWRKHRRSQTSLAESIADILLHGDFAAFLVIVLSDTDLLVNTVMVIFVIVAVFGYGLEMFVCFGDF
jgi:hypothetical protein